MLGSSLFGRGLLDGEFGGAFHFERGLCAFGSQRDFSFLERPSRFGVALGSRALVYLYDRLCYWRLYRHL